MSGKKILSSLAQYKGGQLMCIVCNVPVKSELYWTGHVNGRVHRDNINLLKRKADAPTSTQQQQQAKRSRSDNNNDAEIKNKGLSTTSSSKTPSDVTSADRIIFKVPKDRTAPQKVESSNSPNLQVRIKEKDIIASNRTFLENYQNSEQELQHLQLQSVPQPALEEEEEEEEDDNKSSSSNQDQSSDKSKSKKEPASNLPEGFFDDPKLDAKVRGVEFVDPEDAEWDKFVKEIASEELESESILVVDEEESRKERELDEIEEMMGHWQKVIDLEKKKETRVKRMEVSKEEQESSEEDEDFSEELDWRVKKLKRF